VAADPKTTDKPTPDEPPERSKPHDGPKATESTPTAKDAKQPGKAGEGASPHDD
jgi:hypothetical protein